MSSFPALLRRSNLALHDPYITRVYTAPPSSRASGDYGLKFAVHRGRRAGAHVKVASLDAGSGLGADWSSGETEAHFVDAWGTGRVAWGPRGGGRDGGGGYAARRASINDAARDAYADPVFDAIARANPAPAARLVPDVNAMTAAEFAKYLEHVRAHRAEMKRQHVGRADGGGAAATLAAHARAGRARGSAVADFQVDVSAAEAARADGGRIVAGTPHGAHGLSYARASRAGAGARVGLPGLVGRRLERGTQTNQADVAVLGHAAARLGSVDRTTTPVMAASRLRVASAAIAAPPTVLGLAAANAGTRWTDRVSAARRPRPLDSFKFDIAVNGAPDVGAPELGSRAYVGRDGRAHVAAAELARPASPFGAARATRRQGEALEAVRRHERQLGAHADAIDRMLGRLKREADVSTEGEA